MAAVPASGAEDAEQDHDEDATKRVVLSRALAAARQQEYERVTLHNALQTVCVMLKVRGFVITAACNAPLPLLEPDDPRVADALAPYASTQRAKEAERDNEVLLEAQAAAAPRTYTTAHACGMTPEASRTIVAVLQHGNVNIIRDVKTLMDDENFQHAILLTRDKLTSCSRTFVTAQGMEHFLLESVQRPISNHCLIPAHMPLCAERAARVRARYDGGTFMHLKMSDAMVLFLGLKPGIIVAVLERFGKTPPSWSFFEVVP